MSDSPVNNRKIVLKPIDNPKVDIGESAIFSKKVDTNLWETVQKQIKPEKLKEDSIQYQIFKTEQQTQQYEQFLSKSFGNKLDINC